jgi:hypothetical protein
MWPSVVIHENWPVSQRMIVEMGDYAWSEHIVTVFLACQIIIKNVQVQLTVKGKTTPDIYTPPPKAVVPKMWLWSDDHLGWTIAHGDGSTGLMKVFFCYALPTVVQGFWGKRNTSFQDNDILAQLLLGVGCNCPRLFFL